MIVRLYLPFICSIVIISLTVISCQTECQTTTTTSVPDTEWTVMYYSAGDNNLNNALADDLNEITKGTNNNMTIIALVDLHLNTDKEIHNSGKLYKIYKDNLIRINGGEIMPYITESSEYEINTGDPQVLKQFITFCKTYYPADKYALIIGGHGKGIMENDISYPADSQVSLYNSISPSKSMAVDFNTNTNGKDWLFTAELTDAFDYDENVDLLILDCCNMGYAEVAYQYRPSNGSFNASYIAAIDTQQTNEGLQYDDIFSRVTPDMSAVDFGQLVIDSQKRCFYDAYNAQDYFPWFIEFYSMALFDNSQISTFKVSLDDAVADLLDKKDDIINNIYNNDNHSCGYVRHADMKNADDFSWDAYNVFDYLSQTLTGDVAEKCRAVAKCAEKVVLSSFCYKNPFGLLYDYDFINDSCGLEIFCPVSYTEWRNFTSYNATDIIKYNDDNDASEKGYGKFDWCIDGCISGNGTPENWFELLDYWYDTTNDETGGQNMYRY